MENFNAKAFGQTIKSSRLKEGLSQDQASEEIGLSSRYLADIENYGRVPAMKLLFALCRKFNVSLDDFIFPEDHVHKTTTRRQVDSQLDDLQDNELLIIESTIDGIKRSKDK